MKYINHNNNTKKPGSLLDILKGIEPMPDMPEPRQPREPNPEEILQFKTNPLAVIMLHIELESTLDVRNYSGVFEEDDDDYLGYNSTMLKHDYCQEPEFKKTCGRATEIIQYFRDVVVLKKIKGLETSSYEDGLTEFIQLCENNQCKIKHLPLAVKLPEFYTVEQNFLDMTKELDSFEGEVNDHDDGNQYYPCIQCELTPLSVWFKGTKKEKKDHTFLHFKTQDNNLVEVKTGKSDILAELFKSQSFLNCQLNAKVHISKETHPISGFTYLKSHRIEIDNLDK